MGQILRGSATTTEAVRRAIQNSQESLRALATRHGIKRQSLNGRSAPRSLTCLPGPRTRSRPFFQLMRRR